MQQSLKYKIFLSVDQLEIISVKKVFSDDKISTEFAKSLNSNIKYLNWLI